MPGPSSQTAIVVFGAAVVGDQPHAPVGRRVADRVVEQVGEHLLQPLRVAGGLEADRVDLDPQPHLAVAEHALARRAVEQLVHAEALGGDRQRPRLEPREVEQLLDEAAEALRLRERGLDRVRVLDAVGEVLQHRLQRADRRAQLVRDVGDEIAAHPLDVARSAAIALKARASSPTSSRDVAVTRRS